MSEQMIEIKVAVRASDLARILAPGPVITDAIRAPEPIRPPESKEQEPNSSAHLKSVPVTLRDGRQTIVEQIESKRTNRGLSFSCKVDGKKVTLRKTKSGKFEQRAESIRDFSKAVLTDEGKRILGVVHEAEATTFKGLMGRANLTQGQLLGQYRTLEGLGLLEKDDGGMIQLTPHGINTVEGTRPSFGVIPISADVQPKKEEGLEVGSVELPVEQNDAGQYIPVAAPSSEALPAENSKRVRVRDYAKERERKKIREAMKADATGDAAEPKAS